jgi:hypothetical protein
MVFRFGRPSPVLYDRLMVDVVWVVGEFIYRGHRSKVSNT